MNKLSNPVFLSVLFSVIILQGCKRSGPVSSGDHQTLFRPVSYNATSYTAGDSSIFLISGEFHYFRVPQKDWKSRMEAFKAAGGNCIATYVPWILHEPEEGDFLFGDTGIRDLEGFLKTAKEVGLYVLVRPGPYQYSELKNAGLPDWLVSNYPQIKAMKFDGSVINYDAMSYLHPVFIEKVKKWFDAVMPIIAKYTTADGNPVAIIQVDNELTGIQSWRGSIDYNPVTMGFGKKDGRYTLYLEKKYGTIGNLNKHYKTSFAKFEDVRPVNPVAYDKLNMLLREKDYHDFYLSTIAEYVQILTGYVKSYAPDILIVHNSANPEMNPLFRETVNAMRGTKFVLGSDHYYSLDQNWGQNNPTPQYARNVLYSLENLKLYHFPPTVFEMPSGSASDWPPITANDAKACYYTNLALGMKGVNYYIFTGGPNPDKLGSTTDMYDYGAPVSATGKIRPLYYAQKEFASFIINNPWLIGSERMHDCRIAVDTELERAGFWWQGSGQCAVTPPEAQNFMLKGILTTALSLGLSPSLVELDQDDWTKDTGTPVIIASSSVMPEHDQQQIITFIRNGGKVLIAPVLPTLNENLQPCTTLSDFLGNPKIDPVTGFVRANVGGVKNILNDRLFSITSRDSSTTVQGTEQSRNLPFALKKDFNNGGSVILLGIQWTYAKWEQADMLSFLLEMIGLKPLVKSDNPNIWFSILQDKNKKMLFMLNLFTDHMKVSVQVSSGRDYQNVGDFDIEPMSVKTVALE